MKYWYFLVVFFFSKLSYAQERNLKEQLVLKDGVLVGAYANGLPIEAKRLEFPRYYIVNHDIDTARDEVFLVLRKFPNNPAKNEGFIASFSLSTGELIWSRAAMIVNHLLSKKVTVINTGEEYRCYDRINGELLWKKTCPFRYINDENNIIISDYGAGYDLKTGALAWKKQQKKRSGLLAVHKVNETDAIFITHTALQYKNLQTGEGWEYEVSPFILKNNPNTVNPAVAIGIGILTGITGYALILDMPEEQIAFGCSNVIVQNERIFFASSDKMLCLSSTGQVIWQKQLPVGATRSMLIPHGEDLWLINFGYVYIKGNPIKIGIPFIASYRQGTGWVNYKWDIEKEQDLKDYLIKGDTITLLLEKKMFRFNLSKGKIINSAAINEEAFKRRNSLVDPEHIVFDNQEYKSGAELYPNGTFLQSADQSVLRTDQWLNVKDTSVRDIALIKGTNQEISYFQNEEKTILLRHRDKIASLNGTSFIITNSKAIRVNDEYIDIAVISP